MRVLNPRPSLKKCVLSLCYGTCFVLYLTIVGYILKDKLPPTIPATGTLLYKS